MTQAGWRYQVVSDTFWEDAKVRSWSEDARHLALYLLTCPQRTSEGFFKLPRAVALDGLAWEDSRWDRALAELIETDFADYDDDARLVFIARALKYGPPIRGPKSVKGALNMLDKAKGSPRLFGRFLTAADRYEPELAAEVRRFYDLPDGPFQQ